MKTKKAVKLAEKGNKALSAGDFRAAEEAFAEALKLDESTSLRGFFRMSMLALILNDQDSKFTRQTVHNLVYYGGE